MKLRSFFYGLVAIVLVLFLLGATGFFWITANSPLALLRGGPTASPTAAMFVPKQAPVMASLLVNPDRLASLRQLLAKPGERRQAREELERLQQSLLASTELNYQQDIRPWLGDEVTWAVTTPDIDRDPENGRQPGYLLAIATKKPERSREFLQLFWQKRTASGTDLAFEQYKGVKLIYSNPKPQVSARKKQSGKRSVKSEAPQTSSTLAPSLASAVVGDRFVLFANHPKVLRDAINNVQAEELNLNHSRQYQQALENFNQRSVGLAFVNLPQLLGRDADDGLSGDDPTASSPYESLTIGLGLNRQGLIAQTALTDVEQVLPATTAALTKPVGALQYIPANSSLVASGTDLQQFWSKLSTEASSYTAIANLLNQPISKAQNQWQIDLPQEIFSWVQGEYALALLPQADRDRPDWVFVVERTPAAISAIQRLDELAQQRGLSVGPLALETRQVSAWTQLNTADADPSKSVAAKDQIPASLMAQVQGVHATVGNYELLTTSVEAMNQALQAAKNGLLTRDSFQKAIATLPKDNNGYFYLDWPSGKSLVEEQLPLLRLLELTGQPFFSNLRSLTVTSLGSETGVRRGEVLLQLGQPKRA